MSFWNLVGKEIRFRKIGFIIGLISVVAAIGVLVGAVTLLEAHDVRTEQILTEREKQTRRKMEQLEDDTRRIMRDLGYNVMVLHEDQSIAELRSAGYPAKLMPEEYVHRLGAGGIETLNHLLPLLQKRIAWPEQEMDVILTGTPGQVPVLSKPQFLTDSLEAYRNPIRPAIPTGSVEVGHGIAQDLGLRVGDTIVLEGREFQVDKVHPPQGNSDDLTIWCDLDTVQQMLGLEGSINAILALECVCEADKLGKITEEVRSILPDTQVLEFSSRIIARAEARNRAELAHREAIEAEMTHRQQMGDERRTFASVLVPVVLAGSGMWMFFLVLGNVRERQPEIGILRAIGVGEGRILGVFMSKALIMGVVGAVIGYFAGVAVGATWGGVAITSSRFLELLSLRLFAGAVVVACALCLLAGWLPAMWAAKQDPAVVLRED